jgi:thiol-disulfide isomerase/thioredoxin
MAITRSEGIAILLGVTLIIIITAGIFDTAYSQGEKAPDFNLKTLDGSQITLDSFTGKPVVLWFMATWCPSCVGQADAIKQVKSEYGDKVNILAIDLWSVQSISGGQEQGLGGLGHKKLTD